MLNSEFDDSLKYEEKLIFTREQINIRELSTLRLAVIRFK